jgi:hypothetical protein
MNQNVEIFDHLVYVTPYCDFQSFRAQPQISTVVGTDRVSAIGDFRKLRNFRYLKYKKVLKKFKNLKLITQIPF